MASEQSDGETEDSKSNRWNRLKGRLRAVSRRSDEDVKGIGVNDLSEFLPARRPSQDGKRPLGPRLDTTHASRWPNAAQVLALRNEEDSENLPPFVYRRPQRRFDLHVRFTERRPEVIGQGGDESEEAVVAIARRKQTGATAPRSPPRQLLSTISGGIAGGQESIPPYPYPRANIHPVPPLHRAYEAVPLRSATVGVAGSFSDRIPQPPVSRDTAKIVQQAPEMGPGSSAHALHKPRDTAGSYNTPPTLKSTKSEAEPLLVQHATDGTLFSRMRAEEGKTFLSAGSAREMERPGSSGSQSATSRSSLEERRISRKPHGRRTSPYGADPSDPVIFQLPQYPTALTSTARRQAPSVPERQHVDHQSETDTRSRQLSQQGLHPSSQHELATLQPVSREKATQTARSPSPRSDQPLDDKRCLFKCDIESFRISTTDAASSIKLGRLPKWHHLQVFQVPLAESENTKGQLRIAILVFDSQTSFTDSAFAPGSLRVDQQRPLTIEIVSRPSHLRKLRIRSGQGEHEQLSRILKDASDIVRSRETVQTYEFASVADLKGFEAAITTGGPRPP